MLAGTKNTNNEYYLIFMFVYITKLVSKHIVVNIDGIYTLQYSVICM